MDFQKNRDILRNITRRIKNEALLFTITYLIIFGSIISFADIKVIEKFSVHFVVIFFGGIFLTGFLKYLDYRQEEAPKTIRLLKEEKENLIAKIEKRDHKFAKLKVSLLSDELREQVEELDEIVAADVFYPDDDITDDRHHYTNIIAKAHVDSKGNYEAVYKRDGINVSNKVSRFLLVQTSASRRVKWDKLKMRASDIKTGEELAVECFDDNNRRKKYRIYFAKPIAARENFSIEWSFTWPECIEKHNDGDLINLSQFKMGVEKFTFDLTFDWRLKAPILRELRSDGLYDCENQPIYSSDNGTHRYFIEINPVNALAYLFWFK